MPSSSTFSPTTFYLNEQHELSRGEREGGGRFPQYHGSTGQQRVSTSKRHWNRSVPLLRHLMIHSGTFTISS